MLNNNGSWNVKHNNDKDKFKLSVVKYRSNFFKFKLEFKNNEYWYQIQYTYS